MAQGGAVHRVIINGHVNHIDTSSSSGRKRGANMTSSTAELAHPERKEIARYLLSRGLDPVELIPAPARIAQLLGAAAPPIDFPTASCHGLRPWIPHPYG
jgi:hypothetical protein